MLEYGLGILTGIIFTELLHANYRNPPGDISEKGDSDNHGDRASPPETLGLRYWKKNVPEDVWGASHRTRIDR